MKAAATTVLMGNLLLAATPAQAQQEPDLGRAEFQSGCAACHGADGKGTGPLAQELKKAPPDLTTLAKKNNGVFPLNYVYEMIDGRKDIRAHGNREMPVWGYRYTPAPRLLYSPTPGQSGSLSSDHSDLYLDPESTVRQRVLAVVDYLYRIQEK
jgi:hypothetical protein